MIGLIPVVYLLSVWKGLPDVVPLHYNSKMEVDRYGSKMEFMMVVLLMPVIATGLSLLLNNLHKIDPKRVNSSRTTVACWGDNSSCFSMILYGALK